MPKHIVIVAGEESGDQHAALLLQKLLARDPHLRVSGFGGRHLEALGMNNVLDLTQLAITGISGILGHVFDIYDAFKRLKSHLRESKPDLVILVDYPGFNLRMARWIKKNIRCPILYYISPQIWAWKEGRIQTIRETVDHMAVILPFETDIYRQANVPVTYVGHPLMHTLADLPSKQTCRTYLNIEEDAKVLALLPGSRRAEIKRHMPVIIEALQQLPNAASLQFIIPIAKSLNPEIFKPYVEHLNIRLVAAQAQQVVQAADAVVVASGTASLECALLAKPACIIYKSSWFNYYLATKWIKVKYLGLSNLLLNAMVLPELLQNDCNPLELSKMIQSLLRPSAWKDQMQARLLDLKDLLYNVSGQNIEDVVEKMLQK